MNKIYFSLLVLITIKTSLAAKKTQSMKLGGDWAYELWDNMVYVLADKGRKHQEGSIWNSEPSQRLSPLLWRRF